MKAVKITTKNEFEVIEIENVLKDLQAAVDGHIEIVHPRGLKAPYAMIVDEEGILKYKPVNDFGSYLYLTHEHGHPIVGDVIIMAETDISGERDLAGLSKGEIELLEEYFLLVLNRLKGKVSK